MFEAEAMRFAIFGAGGMGACLGGNLAQAWPDGDLNTKANPSGSIDMGPFWRSDGNSALVK